jgi:pimeloyl-ACP methyl ester carboxylesterase
VADVRLISKQTSAELNNRDHPVGCCGTLRVGLNFRQNENSHRPAPCSLSSSGTNFTEDLKIINVPTLVMHGDDDQIVPIADSALLSAKLLKKATLKVYKGFPHGMCTTHADTVNPDLLAFVETPATAAAA